jgi:MFS family permease
MHIFGVMMASISTKYYQLLLAQGVCSAIGVSAISQPSFAACQGWFSKKRGAAFGILTTGSSIGGVVLPIMLTRLIRDVGFGWSMRISGFLMLGLLIIANLTVRAYHPPTPQKVTAAQLVKPFTEPRYMFLLVGFFLFTFGNFIPITFLPVQALASGMDPDLVQYLLPILNAASLFGRLISGFYSDKVGRFNVFIIVCSLAGVWILALWLPDTSTAATIAFAALFGFFSGAYVSLIAPLIMQVSPMSEIGFRTGLIFLFASIAGLATNPMNGAILDGSGGWVGLKVTAGVFCLAGTASVAAGRVHATGFKLFARF